MSVAGNLGYGYYYSPKYYSTYNTLFKASRIVSAASTTASVFSDVNETIRSQTASQNGATLEAVSKTTDNAIDFVAEKTATKIKISEIKEAGKKSRLIIEAGSNIGLAKGEQLNVVRITSTTIAGKVVHQKTTLGEIEVEELIEDVASSCSIEDGRDEILKAYKENPTEVMVIPQIKAVAKK